MFIIDLLLAGVVLLAGRIVLLYLRPERDCRWCGGKGRRLTLILRRKRACWRCKDDGHVWRLGARTVRKGHLAAVDAWNQWRDAR
jgi:hypothetical protein